MNETEPSREDRSRLNVQVATLPHSQLSLDIEVESSAIGNAIDRAYRNLAQRVSVPGFRKGKAPRAVLEAAIGRASVLEEAADIAVNTGYRQALEQTGLQPITQPEIDVQGNGIDPSQPLFFTAKFYVYPKVELGDYRSIRVDAPRTPVTDEAVDGVLTRMAESQAPWEPVEDRPAEVGDVAKLTLMGTVDGETVVDNEEQEHYLNPSGPTSPETMPDLTPHIVGMSVGESRDFELTLPEGYQPPRYAGKTLACHATLTRLERRAIPALDDAFAQSLGEFASLDDLRARARLSLEAQQRNDDAEAAVAEVTRRVLEASTVDLPPPMVEDEIHRTLDNLKDEIESQQRLTMDLYLRLTGKTMDDLHEEIRPAAEERVKSNLVLEAIAAAEDIKAPRQQVDAELREIAALPTIKERDRRNVLSSPTIRARVETRLERRLALQRLLEIAHPADTDGAEGDAAADEQVRQQAIESHADALESPTHQPSEEEI